MSAPIAIIGAGLTGLTLAFKLRKAGLPVIVIEQSNRPGGVIRTETTDGFTYEGGPNSGVLGNVEVVRLFDELNGRCQLQTANEAVKRRYILYKGKWHALPSGFLSAVTTPLFTLGDKFRILGEPFRKPGTNPHETLAQLVIRRMGRSFLDYAIDPFILGVYAGDPSLLVPKYALPKLYNLEQDYGSFIRGTIAKAKMPKTDLERRVTREVFTVKGGLQRLSDALYHETDPENFIFSATNVQVWPADTGYTVQYDAEGSSHTIEASKVVTTTGAYTLPRLLPFVDDGLTETVAQLHYTRVVELQIGFKKWTGRPLDGFGGLIPSREGRRILGVMFMSALVDGRAPKDGALFAVFVGGVRHQHLFELPDDKLQEVALEEFAELMECSEKPDLVVLSRYQHAIPQYYADSGQRFEACDKIEAQYPGLHIAGNLRNGIGMADRIQQAADMTSRIITEVRS